MAKKRFPLYATLLTFFLLAGLVFVAAQDTGGAPPAPAGGGLDENAVVFELGDEQITAAQFETRFDVALRNLAAQQGIPLDSTTLEQFAGLRPAFLEQFATEQVLLQEATARGLEPSDEEVDTQVAQARENAGENYEALLAESGFADEAALRELIRESVTLQNIVAELQAEVQGGDQAVTDFYETNQAQFESPEEVCARHILVEDEATADELLTRIEGGAPFAQVAENNSTDPGSAQNGGDLGCLARGATVPPFDEAAFAADVGETVGPVQSDFGYHIIRVYDRNPAGTVPLDEVRPQIEQQLSSEGLSEEVEALVAASGVQIFPENLPVTAPAAPAPMTGGDKTGGAQTGGAQTGGAQTGGGQ